MTYIRKEIFLVTIQIHIVIVNLHLQLYYVHLLYMNVEYSYKYISAVHHSGIESVQNLLCKLAIEPRHVHLVEIISFSLYIRSSSDLPKLVAFLENEVFEKSKFPKININKLVS